MKDFDPGEVVFCLFLFLLLLTVALESMYNLRCQVLWLLTRTLGFALVVHFRRLMNTDVAISLS